MKHCLRAPKLTHLLLLIFSALVFLCCISRVSAQGGAFVFPNKSIADLAMAEKYKEAEAEMMKLETSPSPLLLAWLMLKQGKKQEGLTLLEKYITEASEPEKVARILSSISILSDAECSAEAEQWQKRYDNAIKSDDSLPAIHFQLGQLLRDRNRASADELIDQVLAKIYTPDSSEMAKAVVFQYIVYLYTNEDPAAALIYLDKLMQKFPETKLDPAYQMQKANILSTLKKPLDSLKILDRIQTDYPDYYNENKPRFYLTRGCNYEDLGEYEKAKQEQLTGQELCKANPHFKGLLMPFELALQKHADREFAKKANDDARHEAMGGSFDIKDVTAQKPLVLRRITIILVANAVLIALIVYRICRKKKTT
ncbi:MAG: hypothetical protein Q4G68_04125 [Planctomycetia bacterium]|nr:hypothetical protein [Planctomycetia bacterium]